MTNNNLIEKLNTLLAQGEGELVEFKQGAKSYSTDKIGRYFSGLANEANLKNAQCAWLIFGVDNKSHKIVGSEYRINAARLQSLKKQIGDDTNPSITFLNIHEVLHDKGRVVMFEIPTAPRGMPIAWKGHYYARDGESLVGLSMNKIESIRQQTVTDWSAEIVKEANVSHLDKKALNKARRLWAAKHKDRPLSKEIMDWSTIKFLERAQLALDGKITRAAILLLGKATSAHLLSHPAQIVWKLQEPETDYEHFGPPFLLNTSALYQKIRNTRFRILPEDGLLAIEMTKYDSKVVHEALHNCIVHQDYTLNSRIVVTEWLDKLTFESKGNFFDGSPDEYVEGNKTPHRYRNTLLSQAMVNLNMIDTAGYGIHGMYKNQASRFFPMPDYNLDTPDTVCITIYGDIIDETYTRLLAQGTDIPLSDIVVLDRIQKKLTVDDKTVKRLRKQGLIEGRKPNLHISAGLAKVTARKGDYIKTRGQDDVFYKKLILDYLEKFDKASRKEINKLLWNKLSDILSDRQKENKISYLLTSLRRTNHIYNSKTRKVSQWKIRK